MAACKRKPGSAAAEGPVPRGKRRRPARHQVCSGACTRDAPAQRRTNGAGVQELLGVKERAAVIGAAYEKTDLLANLPMFKKFSRSGLSVVVDHVSRKAATPELRKWMLSVTKQAMERIYEAGYGWSDREKRRELAADNAAFLVARDAETGVPVAFIHFRFEDEENEETLYCYEVQVVESHRGRGLGKFLMQQAIESIAQSVRMKCILLTVQKANAAAMAFYTRGLGYDFWALSPCTLPPSEHAQFTYENLVKRVAP